MKKLEVGIKDVSFGENVTIINPVNLYRCEIDDNSFIGPIIFRQQISNWVFC